jgi:hypothetical protein
MRVNKNGNGELVITTTKLMLGIVSFLLFLVGSVATSAVSYGILNNKVDNSIEDINSIQVDIKEVDQKIHENEGSIMVISTKLDTVISTLKDIEKKMD